MVHGCNAFRHILQFQKNYEEADKIRNILVERGIIINDRGQEVDWDINLGSIKK